MNITVVIEARTPSTHLPGKVLLYAAGAPLLQRMVERVCAARTPTNVVIATTDLPIDDAICGIARRADVACIRGHASDGLDCHVHAACATRADAVVKITSDCALIDPVTIDRVIGAFLAQPGVDYASNLHPPTWPDGFNVEVATRGALETAWRDAPRPLDREHTTPFLWNRPERFVTYNVRWQTGLDYSRSHRLILDHAEDYTVIHAIYDELWSPGRPFTLAEILGVLDAQPELCAVNAMHRRANWYGNQPDEFERRADDSPS